MMTEAVYSFLLALAAGLATVGGALLALLSNRRNERVLTAALSFSAGVMICISLLELYPEGEAALQLRFGALPGTVASIGLLFAGAAGCWLVEKCLPEPGGACLQEDGRQKALLRLGITSMAAIFLHNLPEGIATFAAAYHSSSLGVTVAAAIGLHNIPEGIAVALPVWYGTGSRGRALGCALLSGIAEPLGALLAWVLLRPFLSGILLGQMFLLVAGIMLCLAFFQLLPEAFAYGHPTLSLACLFLGIGIIPVSTVLGG